MIDTKKERTFMKKVEKNECQEKVLKDEERREFLDKFGRVAAAVPAGMILLMSPQANAQVLASYGNDDSNP